MLIQGHNMAIWFYIFYADLMNVDGDLFRDVG